MQHNLAQTHHVVESVALKPRKEAGPAEASIGQDHRTNALRQRLNDGRKGVLFELVLALTRRQEIPILSQLQKRQGSSLTRDGDAQNLVSHPLSRRQESVEYRPIYGQTQPARG